MKNDLHLRNNLSKYFFNLCYKNSKQPWPVWFLWLSIVLQSERLLVQLQVGTYMSGLWSRSPAWGHVGGNQWMFLSHIHVSLFFSLPYSPSKDK